MTVPTFSDGQILTAAEMNALAAPLAGAVQAANNGSDFANIATVRSNIGAGTVNSVALSMPGDFTVSGSPVTNAGTIAVTRATQGANLVQAGPASGAAAAPSYRALVPADLPPAGGAMALQAGRFYTSNMIGASASSGTPSTGSLICGTPIYVPNAIALQTLSVETAGAITGTLHARMALYADSNGLPGSPVAGTDTGDLTQTTSGGLTSGTLGVALSSGWYWPVFETSGLAGATVYFASSARPGMMGGTSAAVRATQWNTFALLMTHTYGTALPTWNTSNDSNTAQMPVIALGF